MFLALLALCVSAQSTLPDSAASVPVVQTPESRGLRPYLGGELGVAGNTERQEQLRGYLNMGLYGVRNSLGLMAAFQSGRSESTTRTKVGKQPTETTREVWDDFDLLTLGVDYRHFFRPVGDPKHAPFVSATVARTLFFYRANFGSGPEVARTAFGLALGEEIPVGALFLSGKMGARSHLMIDNYVSFDSTRNTTYTSRETHLITSLDVSLGMTYRF